MATDIAFCCPACGGEVDRQTESYLCRACGRYYPILFGIPDFRLRSDRYLSLEEERTKARALHAAAETMSFPDLLSHYYQITQDVTPERARRFADYATLGAQRAAPGLNALGDAGTRLLDVGCGAGGALISAHNRFEDVVGLDIALRWLVICRKRLEEEGRRATLVCADIESPPFSKGQFSHILAMDVIEHVYDVGRALPAMRAQLQAGGLLWASALNSRWIGPHPSIGVWAAFYLPRWMRSVGAGADRYDPLRFSAQLSPAILRRACVEAGLEVVRVEPRQLGEMRAGGRASLLASCYESLARNRFTRPALTAFGPAFQVLARAP